MKTKPTATKEQYKLISLICDRAEKELSSDVDRVSLMMDLASVPSLDFDGLLIADEFNFAHDVCGIVRHMDRSSWPGKLRDCFVPRYCRGQLVAA